MYLSSSLEGQLSNDSPDGNGLQYILVDMVFLTVKLQSTSMYTI